MNWFDRLRALWLESSRFPRSNRRGSPGRARRRPSPLRRLYIEPLEERILLNGGTFPTPLDALLPAGSLLFTQTASTRFDAPGQVDNFTLSLDADQSLALLFSPQGGPSTTRLRLFDPAGVPLGSAESDGPVLLPLTHATAAGTYTIEVSALAGSGDYQLSAFLNAVLEQELVSGTNNTTAAAQDLSPSSFPLGAGDRLAARGQTGPGDDFYSFTLDAGSVVTLALAGTSALGLELRDAAGQPAAVGLPGADPLTQEIRSLPAPATGTYYARVSGAAGVPYQLVVARNADLENEPNNTLATADDIGSTFRVFGSNRGSSRVPPLPNETEPNNNIAQANDLSGSFQLTSPNTYDASVQGTVSAAFELDSTLR